MRILQVSPKFHESVASGSTKVAYDISRELVRRGHSVTVYTSDMKDKYSRVRAGFEKVDGMSIYRFQSIGTLASREMKVFATPSIISKLKSEIQSFDVVHLQGYRSFQNILAHQCSKKCSVPYVLQAHGSLPRIMAKQKLKWVYDVLFGYRLLRDASKVIALSQVEAEQYKCMGVLEEKIAIIPNGIDLSEYVNLPPKGLFKKKLALDDNEKFVLYLGRVHRIKGVDILVRAFADVVRKLGDVQLVIVGPDDGFLGELQDLIKALKIGDNVVISDPLYGRDKLEAYVDADVYVLPSRYETFPMSILEAVACRTPVVLTRNCGISDYFGDKVGLVVDPDSTRLSESLLEMLLDQERHDIFRENCNALIKRFSISKTVSKLEEVYEKIVS